MAKNDEDLHAGFTGTPIEPSDSVAEKAKAVVSGLKDEASAVSAAAAEHPHTATALLVTIGAIAFGLGYALGHSSGVNSRQRFWR
ncbi:MULTISPECIES: hypothetical protein [Rhizobium]|uniref:Uncharacterized protein n=1 Tax=Rhizobium rhododendri TaxID=2506430 RepID=A0ABY8IK97_9HYPH|nr:MULTISPECIES: hypothetical protein [Rhizobium]MBZ5760071.1 hypothetical protein [Rhizobium sp. VS19-DR96]MBZ5766448.1 hypothetical protein [Rhizobium sp. VS19-DR129.2]MBZ5774209.1 hypothetical protein [Rhizobium sp. VS19-DRK62.2]MBZ5785281.1 hypothetical protein [Rhizobium sp. VS19-DR121]MBZ5802880.1 hypothetical protein [Rhizobium sp. VS19-DR181]